MNGWLKLLGKADWQLPDSWALDRPDLLRQVRFGRDSRPVDIAAGDELVYYAVGWQRIFAVAEVQSAESYEAPSSHEWELQWPWVLDVAVTLKKRKLSEAPSVLELGRVPDLAHQGYVALSADQVSKAKKVLG